ncbi:hypothetical protein NMG60_11021258 [Bertholletia excelsa]
MEGLIPFLLHALRKQRPQHSYRCLSDCSNRSYHLLVGPDSLDSPEGSSHRRTLSEFHPPPPVELAPNFSHSRSFGKGSVLLAAPPSASGSLKQIGSGSSTANLRRR